MKYHLPYANMLDGCVSSSINLARIIVMNWFIAH